MNENQKVLSDALYEYMTEGHITHNQYREVLAVCLVALAESEKDSEPKQAIINFDEMHKHTGRPFLAKALNDPNTKKTFREKLTKLWSDEEPKVKLESIVPSGATIRPEPAKRVVITNEDMVKHLKDSGYTVIKTDELNENYVDVRQLNPGFTVREAWMLQKATEFRQNVGKMLTEQYEAGKITWDEYNEKYSLVYSWRIAMNRNYQVGSETLKEAIEIATAQLNESLIHIHGAKYNVERADEEKVVFEPNAHDERLNEIADKLNKIYARVNVLKEPIVKDVKEKTELDDYPLTKRQLNQIEMHVENMLGKKVMDMQHRLDMNYRHNTKDIADKVKNEIAKEMKENRLKGGLK